MEHDKKKKGTGLRWIPQDTFNLIPRYLIEQVEPIGGVKPEKLYKFGPAICKSPFNILGVFVPMNEDDEEYGNVKGFMWASINPLTEKIDVQMLSIDKEYQGRGIIVEAKNILEKIVERYELKGIKFQTVIPGAFKKAGFIEAEMKVMEVQYG